VSTFVMIHGGGGGAWDWHLVAEPLRAHGHDVVAMDLPTDVSADLSDYVDAVEDAIADRTDLIVVGHSFGGFTAPLVCDRVPVDLLVLLTAMIPAPGEPPDEWWTGTNYREVVSSLERVGDSDDPMDVYYHDVPRELAEESLRRERAHPGGPLDKPWPLDAWPSVPTKFLVCCDDRLFPPEFMLRVVRDRLGIVADEIEGGHCVYLSRPKELAERLIAYAAEVGTSG